MSASDLRNLIYLHGVKRVMYLEQFDTLKEWFASHVAGFYDLDPEGLLNIRMKVEHTWRVVACMEEISKGERLNEKERLLALSIALLHDVGRFYQYRRWRTYRDSESDNHARLSLEVIKREGLLKDLSEEERLIIEEAVLFHNLLNLPEKYSSPTDFFIRLIRDADKLDIWKVVIENYRLPEAERASAVGLGLPDLPEVTMDCLNALAEGKIVQLSQTKFLNDFRLLQISWVYDLNFETTRKLLLEREYLQQLAATLPDLPELHIAVERAISSLNQPAGQS